MDAAEQDNDGEAEAAKSGAAGPPPATHTGRRRPDNPERTARKDRRAPADARPCSKKNRGEQMPRPSYEQRHVGGLMGASWRDDHQEMLGPKVAKETVQHVVGLHITNPKHVKTLVEG